MPVVWPLPYYVVINDPTQVRQNTMSLLQASLLLQRRDLQFRKSVPKCSVMTSQLSLPRALLYQDRTVHPYACEVCLTVSTPACMRSQVTDNMAAIAVQTCYLPHKETEQAMEI